MSPRTKTPAADDVPSPELAIPQRMVDPDQLTPHPRNAKLHDKATLQGSVAKLNQFQSITVNLGHPCQLSAKDDYERSLLHFTADGAVGRLSDIAVQPRPMRAYPGGLQTELTDRRAAEHTATAELKARWPHLIQDKPTRDGYPEIALRLPSLRVQRGGRP